MENLPLNLWANPIQINPGWCLSLAVRLASHPRGVVIPLVDYCLRANFTISYPLRLNTPLMQIGLLAEKMTTVFTKELDTKTFLIMPSLQSLKTAKRYKKNTLIQVNINSTAAVAM